MSKWRNGKKLGSNLIENVCSRRPVCRGGGLNNGYWIKTTQHIIRQANRTRYRGGNITV